MFAALVCNVGNVLLYFALTHSRLLSVFNHHYKNLLLNMPVRHIINKMETDMDKLKMQIARIEKLEINNFFILAG